MARYVYLEELHRICACCSRKRKLVSFKRYGKINGTCNQCFETRKAIAFRACRRSRIPNTRCPFETSANLRW